MLLDNTNRVKPSSPASFDYISYLEWKIKEGRWFPVFRDYFHHFTYPEIMAICHLMNVGKGRPSPDGLVMSTPRFLFAGIDMAPHIQETTLEGLRRHGIVQLEKIEERRHVRIFTDRVEERING